MAVIANTLSTKVELTTYSSAVDIFASTKAKDIPDKLNAIATSLKTNVNTNTTAVLNYVNNVVVPHINTELSKITDGYNTTASTLTTKQNTFETTISDKQTTFETSQKNRQTSFENTMLTGIASYIDAQGVGYTILQSDNLIPFTQTIATEDYTFDAEGKITGIREGYKTTSSITYDSNGTITGFTETLNVNGVGVTKNFTISKDSSGNTLITEV